MANDERPVGFPAASRIDEEGRIHVPAALLDVAGFRRGSDVTIAYGASGTLVVLPATLGSASELEIGSATIPLALREAAEPRVRQLLGLVTPDGMKHLMRAMGTTREELASTLGIDPSPEGQRSCDERFEARLASCLTILAMHDTWLERGGPDGALRDGNLIESYAWYRTAKLVGLGYETAAKLVRQDEADAVVSYLEDFDDGGYA